MRRTGLPDCGLRSQGTGTRARRRLGPAGLTLCFVLCTGCGPLRPTNAHTTSTPNPMSFDVAELTRTCVGVLHPVVPPGLQGFCPLLAHALDAALSKTHPPIAALPAYETMNRLNDHGLAAQYADLLSGFTRSGLLERDALRRVGRAIGCRYLFLPGLAQVDQLLVDRFEAMGLKIVRNRVVTLRLWLQLWDADSGRMLWESSGEGTASKLRVLSMRAIPLDALAESLWLRMIRDGSLSERRPLGVRRIARPVGRAPAGRIDGLAFRDVATPWRTPSPPGKAPLGEPHASVRRPRGTPVFIAHLDTNRPLDVIS